MRVVISQSMYFPWVGLLEQVRLADVFVHYDDVQFTRGFYNRVQVKTAEGIRWLTVPLRDHHRGQRIDEVLVDDREDWRARHRAVLARSYGAAPFAQEMLSLVDGVFARPATTLADVARISTLALAAYFGVDEGTRFVDSAALGIPGRSSERLLDITRAVTASLPFAGVEYITGHGAKHYLDHALFEEAGVDVRYMCYDCRPYPQSHGPFTPYVSALDLIAHCGRAGASFIASSAQSWRTVVQQRA